MDHWIIRLLDKIQYRMDKTINMRLLDIDLISTPAASQNLPFPLSHVGFLIRPPQALDADGNAMDPAFLYEAPAAIKFPVALAKDGNERSEMRAVPTVDHPGGWFYMEVLQYV